MITGFRGPAVSEVTQRQCREHRATPPWDKRAPLLTLVDLHSRSQI